MPGGLWGDLRIRHAINRLFHGAIPLGLFNELDEAAYFRFGFCKDRAIEFLWSEIFPQVGFDLYPLPPAVHDFMAGEILIGSPAVLKGDLMSQEPAPNFQGIMPFDGFPFTSHLRRN